jgi:hypothetical protein
MMGIVRWIARTTRIPMEVFCLNNLLYPRSLGYFLRQLWINFCKNTSIIPRPASIKSFYIKNYNSNYKALFYIWKLYSRKKFFIKHNFEYFSLIDCCVSPLSKIKKLLAKCLTNHFLYGLYFIPTVLLGHILYPLSVLFQRNKKVPSRAVTFYKCLL